MVEVKRHAPANSLSNPVQPSVCKTINLLIFKHQCAFQTCKLVPFIYKFAGWNMMEIEWVCAFSLIIRERPELE